MQQRHLFIVLACSLLLSACQGNGPYRYAPLPFAPQNPMMERQPLVGAVEDALARSGDPVLARLHVEALPNGVALSGFVRKIRQSDVAEQIARKVPGVANVQNNIIVRK
jgi:hyperosmotically inducible protein